MLPPDKDRLVRARQRNNARIMGVLLAALVVLIFLITVAKQTG